tara:strand:+ start:2951 stop:3631 length:681 start_codon:yes stop_codon:yes gene_type:complete
MFLHQDLSVYTNSNFRSYEYLKNIWDLIEYDLIFVLGMINSGNMTIVVDPGICYVTVTSNFINIFEKKYDLNLNHSISLCDDFSIEIELYINNGNRKKDNFYIDVEKCSLYFQKNKSNDEGIVEFSATTNLSICSIQEFKNYLIIRLVKEVQFSINRNIFLLDISNHDSIVAEIDAEFEIVRTYSMLHNKNLKESLKILISKGKIYYNNKSFLLEIIDFAKNDINV